MKTVLCMIFFLLLAASSSFSQTPTNVSFEPIGDSIAIYYDLAGDPEQEYEIFVTLCREDFVTFRFIPKSVTGDVGTGKFSGMKRRIIWAVKKDFTVDPDATDYYFKVDASVVSGTSAWWYIGGAALVGGGAAAVLLLTKKSSPATETPPLPIGAPPVRPGGK